MIGEAVKYLKMLDQFGIVFTPRVEKNEEAYKSALGGIVSLLLYGTGMAYFIYKIYLWQTNQILPQISSTQTSNNYMNISFDYTVIAFTITTNSGINPFDTQNLIFIPMQIALQNDFASEMQPMNIVNTNTTAAEIIPVNLQLILNSQQVITPSTPNYTLDQAIIFQLCTPALLTQMQYLYGNESYQCASSEKQSEYLYANNSNLYLTLRIKQFDPSKRTFSIMNKNIYLQVDPDLSICGQVLLQIIEQTQDTGILFASLTTDTFASDFAFIIQSQTRAYMQQRSGQTVYAQFIIRLDTIKYQTSITYPKLGTILADVGSIITTLFSLQIIIVMINSFLMVDELHMKIIQFYYPDLKHLKINKSIFGRVKDIQYNGIQIKNTDKVMKYITTLKDQAQLKLTVLNSIYEISRLQFIIQQSQSRQQILQCHKIGIELNINESQIELTPQNNVIIPENIAYPLEQRDHQTLNDDDFRLLSLDHHIKYFESTPPDILVEARSNISNVSRQIS